MNGVMAVEASSEAEWLESDQGGYAESGSRVVRGVEIGYSCVWTRTDVWPFRGSSSHSFHSVLVV